MTSKSIMQQTAAVRQEAQKEAVLQQLRQVPVIEIACQRAGVSRPTLYRMRAADEKFKADIEEAIAEGVAFISDLSEAGLIGLIKDRNFAAIKFWLQSNSAKYTRKMEISGAITVEDRALTDDDRRLIGKAMQAALPTPPASGGEKKKDDGNG
jgi:type II secretory pathway component PulJ